MHPAPHVITVRHNPAVAGLISALGAVVLIGGLAFMSGPTGVIGTIGLVFSGAVSLTMGILQFAKPYCVFEPASGTLRFIDVFGYKDKVRGAPVGERLYYNGRNIICVLPDGARRAVKTWPGHAADLPRLYASVPHHPA